MPRLVALSRKHKFQLVTVSVDEPEQELRAGKFVAQFSIQENWIKRAGNDEAFINAVDSRWSGALPALFLYDKSGKLQRSFFGEFDDALLETATR